MWQFNGSRHTNEKTASIAQYGELIVAYLPTSFESGLRGRPVVVYGSADEASQEAHLSKHGIMHITLNLS